MHTLHIVSMGPGSPELLTLGAAQALKSAKTLILRTARHPVAQWLTDAGVAFTSMDALYDRFEDFDELNRAISQDVWEAVKKTSVCFAVPDAASDASVAEILRTAPEGAAILREPGVSLAQSCLCALPSAFSGSEEGLRVVPAIALPKTQMDPRMPLLVTELDDPILAGQVKLHLAALYDEERPVCFFPPCEQLLRKVKTLPLLEVDRQKHYDHTCCLYVPASPISDRSRFCVADLEEIMTILRAPGGCPWDREQTHESLRPYLIEEAYETVGAIDSGDDDRIADELGDVLLQVVFHAQVGASHGTFDLTDVATAICRKMIYRHAHIFGSDRSDTAKEVSANWERLKKEEKGLNTVGSMMDDVCEALPALMRAGKVQSKARRVGFDWDAPTQALEKVREETNEVAAELEKGADPGEELGDLLFACVNVVRLCALQPELVLRQATEKFIGRFKAMENAIKNDGKSLEGLTLPEMDVYWEQVKASQR